MGWRAALIASITALLCAALDLHTKLLMGGWDALELTAPSMGRPVHGWRPAELLEVRIRHQRPDAWSSPYSSRNLSVAPTAARLSHHVLMKLEGRVVLHRYDVPAGPAAVHLG